MKIYCNPYGHLDQNGRLAGACPLEPSHRPGVRAFVAAEIVLVSKEERKGDPRGDREVYGFVFSAEPFSAPNDPGWYYAQRARAGEVFAPRDGKPPMDAWRQARAKAAAEHVARFGAPPDPALWAEQFPLDKEIAGAPAASGGGES